MSACPGAAASSLWSTLAPWSSATEGKARQKKGEKNRGKKQEKIAGQKFFLKKRDVNRVLRVVGEERGAFSLPGEDAKKEKRTKNKTSVM
jgi:hypothetical protein